jgi:signal transduction histidine kinase
MKHVTPSFRQFRPTFSIRGALIGGFAVVFGLWLFSGYELVRSLRGLEMEVNAARASFERGERTLSTVRTSVLLGSIYLRDALIDTQLNARQYYRDELNRIRTEIDQLLPAYLPSVESPVEGEDWARLQTALDDYWDARDVVLAADPPRNSLEAAALLRRRVVPTRDTVLQIVDRLSALQLASQQRHDAEASLLYAAVRGRLLSIGSVAIVLGLFVALVASRHVGQLEREIERRRLSEEQDRRDLERLSARLVTSQEEERRRLARELHDEVGQALTAIKVEMGVALRSLGGESRARGSIEEARAITESTLQNVRDLSQLLHPSMLDDFGLPEALTAYLRSFSKRTGIIGRLNDSELDGRLPPEAEVAVYRIVQEALTNVARHSGARSCDVAVMRSDGLLQLTIEDDGRGIGSMPARLLEVRRGLGLIGMRERAQALGGTFSIENRANGGTRILVRLPLQQGAAPAVAKLAG